MIGSRNPFAKPPGTGLLGLDLENLFGPKPKTLAETIAELPSDPLRAAAPPPQNALAGLLSPSPCSPLPAPNAFPFGIPPTAIPRPNPAPTATPAVRRKVFFSFHYEGDIRRSCIVRKSYIFRPGSKPPSASFYDGSLWEKSQREGGGSLKRLIRQGMAETSVTAVLAGTDTWWRPWVRFEIAHSLFRGNGLFTCFIHNVRDPQDGLAAPGRNPLAFIGLQLRADGRGNVCELIGNEWRLFELMKRPVPWPAWMNKPSVGRLHPLGDFAPAYDYHFDDGYNNLAHWAQEAARKAGRR